MTDSFIVSARKYRPQTWESVVGQESITSTLENAIEKNQIAQGYLFCGPRGVGKTTCARIFAKEINKKAGVDIEDLTFNLFELDGASNNKVEHMRDLIEQVRIPPQLGKYKVYIIDEVHMLSKDAFNAFLKTLEEPPPHAIFILATTEKHKIIPTILSRCQIFDFKRIEVNDIASHLESIAGTEGVSFEPEGLHIIAQKADGAMRDALSIYDQVCASSDNNLSYANVIENLNVLDYDYYFEMTKHMLEEDISQSLLTFNTILNKGFDGHQFVVGLGEHFRNLLVCKDPETVQLLEVSDSVKERFATQAQESDIRWLVKAMDFTNECTTQYRGAQNKRLLVELMIMKLCSIKYNESEKKKPFRLKPFKNLPSRPDAPPTPQPESTDTVDYSVHAPRTRKVNKPLAVGRELTLVEEDEPIHELLNSEVASTNTEVAVEEEINDSPSKDFEREEFISAWNDFKSTETILDKPSLLSTLNAQEPILEENGKIVIPINNTLQEVEINEVRPIMLEFLKSKLGNYRMELVTQLSEKKADSPRLYTDRDKFNAMKEMNPELEEFRKKLDLDLDF